MGRQIFFFALREDILPVLEAAEQRGAVTYVRVGNFLSPQRESFTRAAEIPRLGIAAADASVHCEAYLATASGTPVLERRITIRDGSDRF